MIDKNNLNRIKGILSAKKGAEIPKFLNSGSILDPYFIEFLRKSNLNLDPESIRIIYNNLKTTNPTDSVEQLIERYKNSNNSNNSRNLIEMEVPGAPVLNPNSAIETAALDNLTEFMLNREDNIKNAALIQPITNTNIQGVTVPKPVSLNTNISQLLQKAQARMKQEAESYRMNLLKQAAKKEKWKNFGMQAAGTAVAAFEGIGDAIGAKQMATNSATTNMADSLYDTTTSVVEQLGPIGKIAGTAMKYAGIAGDMIQELGRATGERMDTDQMTATDKWMDSSFFSWNIGLINGAFGKNTQDFGIDQSTLSQVGSSYGGTVSDLNEANEVANKRYGLFSKKKRREADNNITAAKFQQNVMANIADTATDQRNYAQSMGEQAGLAYSLMTDGGYNQKYTYAAKQGGLLEWNPTLEIEWEPQIEINWELPTFKEGGNINIVEELEWIPEFKDGGKTKDSDIPEIEETSQKNVIPEGALHKNKHHMEHAEGLTKKGIPVIDDNGEQQAEIEHSEIIFTLEVTKKLEEYYKIFYSEESSNKEKELAALDAGKLLVYQILENTEDRTGLIESCKKGGTLTIKESEIVEDLLDWMPTIMIVEEIKEEIEEEKPKKKSELEKDDLKELVKDVIKEALIELLIK